MGNVATDWSEQQTRTVSPIDLSSSATPTRGSATQVRTTSVARIQGQMDGMLSSMTRQKRYDYGCWQRTKRNERVDVVKLKQLAGRYERTNQLPSSSHDHRPTHPWRKSQAHIHNSRPPHSSHEHSHAPHKCPQGNCTLPTQPPQLLFHLLQKRNDSRKRLWHKYSWPGWKRRLRLRRRRCRRTRRTTWRHRRA